MKVYRKKRLVYGVGINDADYVVQPTENGKTKMCIYYQTWKNMLRRCYSEREPTYIGCFATPEEAHQVWLKAKLELAKELAAEILAEGGDPRVAKALVDRYEYYKENV